MRAVAPRPSNSADRALPACPARGSIASTLATIAAVLLTMAVMATVPGAGSGALMTGAVAVVDGQAPGMAAPLAAPRAFDVDTAPAARAHLARSATLARRAGLLPRHTSLPPPARA